MLGRALRISVCRNTGQDVIKAISFILVILAVLLAARFLRPDPRGLGTHTQLFLPPCSFQVVTGLPCPACGLTTSFAYMARGELRPALASNLLGPPLFTGALLFLLYQAGVLVFRKHLECDWSVRTMSLLALAVVLVMALYGAWRIVMLKRP